jgi:peptidoglycan/xylan/chitin deacetylase (PgdA/CDA1 family)
MDSTMDIVCPHNLVKIEPGFPVGYNSFGKRYKLIYSSIGKYITISVDDGHPKDLIMADLPVKYDLKATFYDPCKNVEREVLLATEIRHLAEIFEIGSHTYNHKVLKGLPRQVIRQEVLDGKNYLEELLGKHGISLK